MYTYGVNGLTGDLHFSIEYNLSEKRINIQWTDKINVKTEVIASDGRTISTFEHSIEAIQKRIGEIIRSSVNLSG